MFTRQSTFLGSPGRVPSPAAPAGSGPASAAAAGGRTTARLWARPRRSGTRTPAQTSTRSARVRQRHNYYVKHDVTSGTKNVSGDGYWGEWNPYTECSSCQRSRTRLCVGKAPEGRECVADPLTGITTSEVDFVGCANDSVVRPGEEHCWTGKPTLKALHTV